MKSKKRAAQVREIIRFLLTGIVCFAVEFVLLVMLKELFRIDTLIATPIAFLGSVTVNYLMCIAWVFEGTKNSGRTTQLGFMITSVMGLLFNELFMLVFRLIFGEGTVLFTIFGFAVSMYMVNKALATLLVMVWNYFTKRAMLQSDWLRKMQKKNNTDIMHT